MAAVDMSRALHLLHEVDVRRRQSDACAAYVAARAVAFAEWLGAITGVVGGIPMTATEIQRVAARLYADERAARGVE